MSVEATTTRMSSKGQVVIPEEVRQRLRLEAGTRFVVVAKGDVILLKVVEAPALEAFDSLIREARRQARSARMTRRAIGEAIAAARGQE